MTPYLLDVIGEWGSQKKKLLQKDILIKDILEFKLIKYLPKYGFIKSRLSYITVFLFSIFTWVNPERFPINSCFVAVICSFKLLIDVSISWILSNVFSSAVSLLVWSLNFRISELNSGRRMELMTTVSPSDEIIIFSGTWEDAEKQIK